ncbi:MAG: hypothetical protein ACXV2F_03290 [Halobacteriota archaeon]
MTQPKRICAIGAIAFLILLPTALATHALVSPSVSSLALVKAPRDQCLSQAWFFGQNTGAPHSPAMICALVIHASIAQNEIPNVLVPSTIPSAEPSLPSASPTPQPATVSTNSTSGIAPISAGNGFDLAKVIGSISPYLIIALIPLLFVIGALFYFFFMGDQDRGAPSDEKEADVQFADASEDTGWRELK